MKTTVQSSLMALLFIATCLVSGPVFADDSYVEPSDITTTEWSSEWDDKTAWDETNDWACWSYDECCDKASRVYVGPVYFNRRLHYTTRNDTVNNIFGLEGSSRSKGNFVGVNFGYEYKELCNVYGRIDATWDTGCLKGCPRNRTNDWWVDGRIGWTWGECSPCGWSVTPYTGIGYFWINRSFRHTPASVKYESWYVPVGLLAVVEVMPDFTIGVDATWMPEFSSRVSINHHQFANLDKGNNSRYGWRIEVPFTYTLPTCLFDFMSCTELEVCIAPFYQQFYYGHVAQTGLLGVATPSAVPRSREDFWGAKFLFGVRF